MNYLKIDAEAQMVKNVKYCMHKKIQNILKILNFLKTSGSNKVVNNMVTSRKC